MGDKHEKKYTLKPGKYTRFIKVFRITDEISIKQTLCTLKPVYKDHPRSKH